MKWGRVINNIFNLGIALEKLSTGEYILVHVSKTYHKHKKFIHVFEIGKISKKKMINSQISDIQGRSQTLYTTLCNDVVSHGAQIEGVWVFADHTRGNKSKQKGFKGYLRSQLHFS